MKKLLPRTSKNSQASTEQSRSGFTLVELLVVIAIIAILAAVGLTIYSGAQKTARDAKRKADVQAISQAFEAHYKDSSCSATDANPYCIPATGWFANGAYPTDPTGTTTNYYWNGAQTVPTAVAKGYVICTIALENSGTGNSSTTGTASFDFSGSSSGNYYCMKNQQQ